jgi:hypothetical protein
VALFLWARIEIWSLFVNVLNPILLLLMFAGEYGYRLARFRDPPRQKLSDFSDGRPHQIHFAEEANSGDPDPVASLLIARHPSIHDPVLPAAPARPPPTVVARDGRRPITMAEFLGNVAALARRLPARRHVANLCYNRYRWSA